MLDDILQTIALPPRFKQIFNIYARQSLIRDPTFRDSPVSRRQGLKNLKRQNSLAVAVETKSMLKHNEKAVIIHF